MSFGNRYHLPWAEIDMAKVEAAARAATRRWPELRFDVEARDPTRALVFFDVPMALVRNLNGGLMDLDHELRASDDVNTASLPVQIEFVIYAAMPGQGLPAQCHLMFLSTRAANRIAGGAAVEIIDVMGTYLGSTCEPD